MSTCKKEGKDVIIFATAEDHKEPSTVVLPEPDPQPGLILPNGEINWNCPCLGGMASGPCGLEFREAFSCFHNSEAEPKGRDCYEAFKQMHLCMAEYPQLYGNDEDEVENLAEVSEKSEVSLVNNSSKIESTEKENPSNVSKAKVDDRPKVDVRTEPKKSAKEPINSNFSNVNAQ